ncbi:MAG: two-component sensor histidine kinase [Propionibacteriales bacterium]|nr:two-component sensor histidine kinase [Propionibacteriales bacterium]
MRVRRSGSRPCGVSDTAGSRSAPAIGWSEVVPDNVVVALIAAACSGAVGVVGLLLAPVLRRTSVRLAFSAVAVVAVVGFVAGLLGTARAMFLSDHDFGVVLIVCVVAGVVSLGFALLLAVPFVRGSRLVGSAARRLGEGGEYAVPSGAAPTRELRALSDELAVASHRLIEAREREQQMEQARRDLVAWVSHDLRSPLAGIRAMAEALEDDIVEDPDRYHRQIRMEVDRMAVLVDDLFTLSRIHAGSLTLDLGPVDLADVISHALSAAEPLARAHDIVVDGASESGLVVNGDAAQLQRAIGNLLANAVQNTQPDQTIRISGVSRDGVAVVSVADACGGIPAVHLSRVFDLGWRDSPARTPGIWSGAGLGLAIVRGIANAHGGSVSVRNEGPGCVFELRLARA